jgi:hypothetical protein
MWAWVVWVSALKFIKFCWFAKVLGKTLLQKRYLVKSGKKNYIEGHITNVKDTITATQNILYVMFSIFCQLRSILRQNNNCFTNDKKIRKLQK